MNKEVVYRWDFDADHMLSMKETNESPLEYSRIESPPFFAAGVPWMLQVITTVVDDEERVYFTVTCIHEDTKADWSIEHSTSFTIINENSENNFEQLYSEDFSLHNPEWKVYIAYADFVDETKGFIDKYENIILEAKITVKSLSGIRTSLEFDFTSPGVGSDDVVLVFSGRYKAHVSRHYLSMHSPYFAALFFKKFEEEGKSEIELPGVAYNCFIGLLYVIYPSYRPLTHWSIHSILELADRFDIKSAMDKAEDFMINTQRMRGAEKLKYADKYRLARVQKQCLSELTKPAQFKVLESEREYKEYSLELKNALFTRLLELIPHPEAE